MGLINDFLQFFFPELCIACHHLLTAEEKVLCTSCLYHLPRTDFHKFLDNPVSQLFWGRVKIEASASWFYYFKGSAYQSIIHKLKYNGRKDIGIELGRIFASEILTSDVCSVDLLIPVPLHPRKLKSRGYNQSEMIAKGMADIMNKEMLNNVLIKTSFTETQTRKSRFDRYLNIEGKFKVINEEKIQNKHILLIDDVITTGATIESCAVALLKVNGVKLSVASLAVA